MAGKSKNNPNVRQGETAIDACPKCDNKMKYVKKVGFAINGMFLMCDCGYERKKRK